MNADNDSSGRVKNIYGLMDNISREVAVILKNIDPAEMEKAEEIRMRAGRPLMIGFQGYDMFVQRNSTLDIKIRCPVIITERDIIATMETISRNSMYSFADDIKNGFITMDGGHRVGITGKTVLQNGGIKTIKEISGLNIRLAKEVKGSCIKILKHISCENTIWNTLIVSPPQCGKTTILRDLARVLSNGRYGCRGLKVGVVDERSEIAACKNGVAQFDIGMRTDILDGCPKIEGIPMIIRTMSPDVVITDEIGNGGDGECILKVLNAGVKIITSAHGYSISEMKTREEVLRLIERKAFERYIVLSGKEGPGTVEEIVDGENMKAIYRRVKNAS